MSEKKLSRVIYNGAIAAIYFLLTTINPLAFGPFQIRISEMLCLLCFYKRDYIFGVSIGCLMANIFSPLGLIDAVVGTSATIATCFLISFASPRLWISCLYAVVVNGFIVGFEMFYFFKLPLIEGIFLISVCEALSVAVGYLIFFLQRKSNIILKVIKADKHLEWKW